MDSGHLLNGLFLEKEGLSAQALLNHGLTEQKLSNACLPYWLNQHLVPTKSWPEKLLSILGFQNLFRTSTPLRFEKLTDEAIQVLSSARGEAARLKNDYVGTEHLLAALTACSAAKLLEELGATRSAILSRLDKRASTLPSAKVDASGCPLSPRVKAALIAAHTIADSKKSEFIGAEHLLAGLLADAKNSANEILKSIGAINGHRSS